MGEEDSGAEVDIGNLAVFNAGKLSAKGYDNIENMLEEHATKNTELILRHVFDLDVDPPQAGIRGRIAHLPPTTTKLPREKPIPKAKELTTWEKFAREKGIVKKKKSRMTFDEEKEQWMPTWGYKKANDESKDWAIPAKSTDQEGTVDPWTKLEQEKKERVSKNKKQETRNLGEHLKGATGPNRVDGAVDLAAAASSIAGTKPLKRNQQKKMDMGNGKNDFKNQKGRSHVEAALAISQGSTASMGKFDKLRGDEKLAKKKTGKSKSQKETKADMQMEKSKSLSVLDAVLNGGKRVQLSEMEKAARLIESEGRKGGTGGGMEVDRRLKGNALKVAAKSAKDVATEGSTLTKGKKRKLEDKKSGAGQSKKGGKAKGKIKKGK